MPRLNLAALVFVVIVLTAAAWAFYSFPAERQIKAKMSKLLAAASARDWKRVGRYVSPSYGDAWGQDRAQALESASSFGRHFLALQIDGAEGVVEVAAQDAVWRGHLEFSGRGTAIGEALFLRAGALEEKFVFAWKRESWKPWDWLLVSVAQPEIFFDSQWLP